MTPYQPGPGDIGLTPIRGDVGKAIEFGEWLLELGTEPIRLVDQDVRYQHAFTSVGDDLIVEAEPGGARLAHLSEYPADTLAWLPCPPQYGPAVAEAARKLIGIGYSAAEYFALAARKFHVPAPGLRAYIASSDRLICSQLCDLAAQQGGWRIFDDGRTPGDVAPSDLAALPGVILPGAAS